MAFAIVDYVDGEERSFGIIDTVETYDEAVERADFAITCHLNGIFQDLLGDLDITSVGFADEPRGLHITDKYGEYDVIVAILDSEFPYCTVR